MAALVRTWCKCNPLILLDFTSLKIENAIADIDQSTISKKFMPAPERLKTLLIYPISGAGILKIVKGGWRMPTHYNVKMKMLYALAICGLVRRDDLAILPRP